MTNPLITNFSNLDGKEIMDNICLESKYTLIYKWSTDDKLREEQIRININEKEKKLLWDIELPESIQASAQAQAKAPAQVPASAKSRKKR